MLSARPVPERSVTLRLRHGLHVDGEAHRDAVLRPLCGADELALEEAGTLPARRVTTLLGSIVQSIGAIAPIGEAEVRRLTIGDRERLLLALRAATFGPEVETLVTCGACGATTEVPLDLRDALTPANEAEARAEGSFSVDGLTVRFRLPTGADQERAAERALIDPEAAAAILLGACLSPAVNRAKTEPAPDNADWSALIAALEAAVRAADPDAESVIALSCAGCGAPLRAVLDAHALLRGALGTGRSVLEDVHRLAATYHWTEADILALPTRRRQRYLALLDRAAAA